MRNLRILSIFSENSTSGREAEKSENSTSGKESEKSENSEKYIWERD